MQRANTVTAISRFVADELEAEFNLDPRVVRVIHCPVDELMRPSQEVDFPKNDRVRVLQIGSTETKNFEVVVHALAGTGFELRRIGALTEDQRDLLNRCNVPYGVVSNLSEDELIHEFHQADILAFVSRYEGFGLPVIEGQACGIPVLTSFEGSLPEVAGSGAYFVDADDVVGIRQALVELAGDERLRRRLKRKGFANVVRFEPVAIAEQYANEYRQLRFGRGASRSIRWQNRATLARSDSGLDRPSGDLTCD
jgi:glycosyltransferase involved in cell wall biosynthesis